VSALTDHDRALLVALADDTLRGGRRDRAEALVRRLPDGERLLARQRRVRDALGAQRAPAALAGTARPARVVTWRSWGLRLAPGVALATVVALAVALLPGGGSPVSDAAALAQARATGPPPAAAGPVLRAGVDGVAFPNWQPDFGWRQTGVRGDMLDGRATRTVFYEHMGHRIAYTIVSGSAIQPPSGARAVDRGGLKIALVKDGDRDVAIFERDGHTCVLAGHVMRVSTLIELAAWTGGGAVRG
jgi:hypothetical protein